MAGQGDYDGAKVSSPTHELVAAGERVRAQTCSVVAVFPDGWMYRCRHIHLTGDSLHSWQCGSDVPNPIPNPSGLSCRLPKGHQEDHAPDLPVTVRWYNSIGDQVYRLSPTEPTTVEYDTEEAKRTVVHVAAVLAAYREALSPNFRDEQRDILVRDYAQQMVLVLSKPLMVLRPPVPYQPIKKGEWQR